MAGGTNHGLVLVVDDDAGIRHLLTTALHDEAYEVEVAPDGVQALAAIRCRRPDLIILDLDMPRMDGRAFLEACAQDSTCADVPVLVLSGAHQISEVRGRTGCAMLTKPFDLSELLALVERLTSATGPLSMVGI